jgi:hypothetical protein
MLPSSQPSSDDMPQSPAPAVHPAPGPDGFWRFRIAFLPFWLPLVAISALVDIALILPAADTGYKGVLFVFAFLVTAAAQAGVVAGFTAYFKIYVSDQGIKCPDAWCRYQFAKWNDITRVAPFNVLGLRYFRLFTPQLRRPLWLPLFLSNRQVFWSIVHSCAGSTSPIVDAARDLGVDITEGHPA